MSQHIQQTPRREAPVSAAARMYPTRSYQPREVRVRTVRQLDQLLADTVDLASQARFAHWNVRGMHFYQLHELFEALYEALAAQADDIAERAAALGGQATGTVRSAAASSRIPEFDAAAVTGPECVDQLAERLAAHDATLYEAIQDASGRGDLDTADLLNEVSREVGRYRWFLEAHLDTRPTAGAPAGEAGAVRQPDRQPAQARPAQPAPGQGAAVQPGAPGRTSQNAARPPEAEPPGSATHSGRQSVGQSQQPAVQPPVQ